jgi:hypothetical protein
VILLHFKIAAKGADSSILNNIECSLHGRHCARLELE